MKKKKNTKLDVAYVQLRKGTVAKTIELRPGILMDLVKNGEVIGIEVLSIELQRAAEDMKKVISESQRHFKASPQQTVLISKSFSTKALGPSLNLARAHVLLTPNCSIEFPFKAMYGSILQNRNFKTSIFISNEDPNCDVKQIHQSLIQAANPPSLYLTHGDNNFEIPAQANMTRVPQNIYIYQDAIIHMVTAQVLTEFSVN